MTSLRVTLVCRGRSFTMLKRDGMVGHTLSGVVPRAMRQSRACVYQAAERESHVRTDGVCRSDTTFPAESSLVSSQGVVKPGVWRPNSI